MTAKSDRINGQVMTYTCFCQYVDFVSLAGQIWWKRKGFDQTDGRIQLIPFITWAHRPMMRSMGLFEFSARSTRSLHRLFPIFRGRQCVNWNCKNKKQNENWIPLTIGWVRAIFQITRWYWFLRDASTHRQDQRAASSQRNSKNST